MLNEPLFKAIKQAFKEVPGICKEGEGALYTNIVPDFSLLEGEETLLHYKSTYGGEQYFINCPYCGDTKGRLYISHLWNTSFVYEGSKYRASEKLVNCYNEKCLRKRENLEDFKAKIASCLENPLDVDVGDIEEESSGSFANQVPMPSQYYSLSCAPPTVISFIESRGFIVRELEKYDVFWIPYYDAYSEKKQKWYRKFNHPVLVIPTVQNKEYWFWQARLVSLDGKADGPLELDFNDKPYPKYYNEKGCKKSWALYNIDNIGNGPVYVVEGVTDVWAIGDGAVAKFGKSLSPVQKNTLEAKAKGMDIILIPDMDDPQSLPTVIKEYSQLQELGVFNSVKISILSEGYDVGRLKQERRDVCQIIHSSIVSEEYILSQV